jgi:integrase
MSVYRDKVRGCWVFEFSRRINGRRVRTRKLLPPTWTRAQADAYDRQQSASLYATASGTSTADPPIDRAVLVYLKERAPELKNRAVVEANLALVRWAYKGKTMAQLPEVCQAIVKKWRAELAPATIRNRIRYLTAACRYGWKKHGIGDADPAARVVVPAVKNERRVFIDRRQMLALARACPHKPTRAAIRIAFYSGMRISEIIRAERIEGAFVLHDTKNGQPRIVPMHPRLRCCAHIRQVEASATSAYFRAARAAAGMPWLHFHDLRHSAASELINSGVDLYTVGAVLGHKSSQSTKRYAHLATDTMRAAIGRIGQKLTHQGQRKTS